MQTFFFTHASAVHACHFMFRLPVDVDNTRLVYLLDRYRPGHHPETTTVTLGFSREVVQKKASTDHQRQRQKVIASGRRSTET